MGRFAANRFPASLLEQPSSTKGSAYPTTVLRSDHDDPIGAAAILLLSASPVLAADTMKPSSQPAGENAAGTDTSSGAKEQSSAPPGSPAESDLSNKSSTGTGADTSGGAMERSSAPPGSSAAEPSKPNPTLNSTEQQDQTKEPGQ